MKLPVIACAVPFFCLASAFSPPRTTSTSFLRYYYESKKRTAEAVVRIPTQCFSDTKDYNEEEEEDDRMGIVAPLTFVRGCPLVSLEFGDNAVLDFVLSTGSNVNTIHPDIVEQLAFETEAPFTEVPVVACGMGKYFDGKSIMMGDAKLRPSSFDEKPLRLDSLFAVNLPLEPAGHGQLGAPFFYTFAAVEFAWHGLLNAAENANAAEPTLGFYLQDIPLDQDASLTRIPIARLPAQIPLLQCTVNTANDEDTPSESGKNLHQAILATCSPVTILSPAAAGSMELSEDVFAVNALDGSKQVNLRRSAYPVNIKVGNEVAFDLGESYVYVGDLPGHDEFLQEADMVLGTDFLRNTYRMVLTEGAAYFEEYKES